MTSINTLSAEDEHAIRDLVALADRSQADPAVLPGLHTESTVIVNFYGRRLFGRDTFTAAMSAALDSGLGDVRTSVEIIDVRALTADAVLVSCVKTVHDQRPGAETTPIASAPSPTWWCEPPAAGRSAWHRRLRSRRRERRSGDTVATYG